MTYETEVAGVKKVRDEYIAKWPLYCKKCEGWGGRTIPATYEEPEDFDECSACLSKGHCPRCGKTLDDGAVDCVFCNWLLDTSFGLPEFPDPPEPEIEPVEQEPVALDLDDGFFERAEFAYQASRNKR